ncbi:MAG: DoxX family protein [Rhodospirillaceae bacterium]|nr:DoxX family protein [Rhodospirillaceae bacterium]MDE0000090.1 DoxX family protein [Rhodospirillaceae bacterium]
MNPESSYRMAYALFRITLGVNMFFHGFMRIISDTGAWVEGLVLTFSDSFLPEMSVRVFLHVLPYYELVLGALLTLGLFTWWTCVGGALMMLVLLFGNTTRQDWGTAGNNMHYTLYFCLLIAAHAWDSFCLDNRRAARS